MVDHSPQRTSPIFRSYPRLVAASGILIIIGSSVIFFIDPLEKSLAQVGFSLGLGLILVAVLLRPATVHLVLTGRKVQYASNTLIMCLSFAGILLLINFVSFKHGFELDLTETSQFTLSPQTITILENLTEPVQIVGFFKAGDYRWTQAAEFLERYSRHTELLSYGIHDPISEPSWAESYQFHDFGLVFVNGVHRYEVANVDEQSITTGLMCVTTHKHDGDSSELITIDRPQPTSRELNLNPLQTGVIFLVAAILIPLVWLTAGTWVWWLRS